MTRAKLPLLVCTALFLIYLVPLGMHPLLEPDEGRYAEIPREMLESGDYVTPRLNYVRYFEKPPMLYWMNAASFHLLGQNAFSARIPTALSALLGIGVAGMLGRSVYGRRAGLLAAVVTGTSLLYYAIGTINLTDMMLSFFLTAAMSAWFAAWRSGKGKWYALFYAAMALGVLTKGLIAVVLPGGIILCFAIAARKPRAIVESLYAPGILLFFAIAVPWFWLVCRENPDFFRFFFIQEHFLRYTTTMHDRNEPFWFFLPLIVAGVMPWIGFLFGLASKRSILRAPSDAKERETNIFMLLWFGVPLLFFSASGSKLIPYIVPCIPPLALLIGADLARIAQPDQATRRRLGGFAANAAVNLLFAAALFVCAYIDDRIPRAEGLRIAALVSVPLIVGAILSILLAKKRRDFRQVLAVLVTTALLFIAGLMTIYGPIGRTRSIANVAETVLNNPEPGRKIAVYGEILQAMPFYTKQRVALIDYVGELEFGASDQGAPAWFPSGKDFLDAWNAGEPTVLVIETKRVPQLFGGEISNMERRVESGDYLIVTNKTKRER